jgi:hypothetical protein
MLTHIEHMFDMPLPRPLKLVGGPYNGKTAIAPSDCAEFWVYLNMYNSVMTCPQGAYPETPSMATYAQTPDADVATYVAKKLGAASLED